MGEPGKPYESRHNRVTEDKKATLASGLFFHFAKKFWLPTVDILRNLFYAPRWR